MNDFVAGRVAARRAASGARHRGERRFARPLGERRLSRARSRPRDFMKEPVGGGPGYEDARRAMVDLLEYRLLEDLARAWRVAQPNLEQCGLLRIELSRACRACRGRRVVAQHPGDRVPPAQRAREAVLGALLDHLRSVLAIDARRSPRSGPARSRRASPRRSGSPGPLTSASGCGRQRRAVAGGGTRPARPSVTLRLSARSSSVATFARDGPGI